MTKIEWTEETWNPVTGCSPISAGCKHCYAKRMAPRLAGRFGYSKDDPFQVTIHEDKLEQPEGWRNPKMIFVCSMGDLFHEDVPNIIIWRIFQVMVNCQQHTFQVLTKRPERMLELVPGILSMFPDQMKHIWLGVTIENQKMADSERLFYLMMTPAAKRFISFEPMLGPVEIPIGPGTNTIHQIICGGESGPGARPMHPDWVRSLRDQCQAAGVPFFFKQWGAFIPYEKQVWGNQYFSQNDDIMLSDEHEFKNDVEFVRVGKKKAGRMLDGRTWDEYPG